MSYNGPMERKQLGELHEDPKNPRVISNQQAEALAAAMKRWGDLSPIVFNVRTQQLVGGHQRIKIFTKVLAGASEVQITQRFTEPDVVGTVALGYVVYEGRTFAYREVDWPEGEQKAANQAANKISGEFDDPLLAQSMYELSLLENGAELMALTGHSDAQIKKMLKSVGVGEPEPEVPAKEEPDKLEFALTRDQRLIIERALELVKRTRDLQAITSPSLNGSALFVMASEYIEQHPEPDAPSGELTEIPN